MNQAGLFALAAVIALIALFGRWPGRYQMQPFDGDRFLRLDTMTGEVTICSLRTGFLRNSDAVVCDPEAAPE